MTWSEVPELPVAERQVPLVVPWLLAVVPLWAQFERLYYERDRHFAMLIVAALFLLVVHWWPRLVVPAVVAGTVLLVPWFGVGLALHVAPLLFVPLTVWGFATGALRAREGSRWPTGPLLYPACVAVAVSGVSLYGFTAFRFAMICLLAAGVLAVVGVLVPGPLWALRARMDVVQVALRPGWERVVEVLRTGGRWVGRLAGAVVMIPGALLIAVVWFPQRVFRVDPLARAGHRPGSAWSRRVGADPFPGQLFSGVRPVRPSSVRFGLQRTGAMVLSIVVLLAVFAPEVIDEGARIAGRFGQRTAQDVADQVVKPKKPKPGYCPSNSLAPDAAMDQDRHWPRVACETNKFSSRSRFDGVTTYTIADYDGRYVNVEDGVRRTWRPPACSCRRVKVLFLGGSAAFGWYQRDEFSPPSMLAKEAWKAGIALDITVRAMPGWVTGQEVREFLDVVTAGPKPDVVVFYHGGNDLNRQVVRNIQGLGADESATSSGEEPINRLLAEGPFPWRPGLFRALEPDEAGPVLGPRDVARHAMNRYRRETLIARRMAASIGAEPVFVWQALGPAAPKRLMNRNGMDPQDRVFWQRMLPEVRRRLPDDAIDLTRSLSKADRIVFKDLFHTNEYGAALVAEAMFQAIRPQLAQAAG